MRSDEVDLWGAGATISGRAAIEPVFCEQFCSKSGSRGGGDCLEGSKDFFRASRSLRAAFIAPSLAFGSSLSESIDMGAGFDSFDTYFAVFASFLGGCSSVSDLPAVIGLLCCRFALVDRALVLTRVVTSSAEFLAREPIVSVAGFSTWVS